MPIRIIRKSSPRQGPRPVSGARRPASGGAGRIAAMQAQPTPLANRLLIALPALADPHFVRSVALVCQHDEEGAMGVLVNRPSEFTLGDVFEQMGIETRDEALRSQIVLSGGPVHPERGFVLHDGGDGWDSTLAVSDQLYVTTSRDILEAMAGGNGPKHAVVALG